MAKRNGPEREKNTIKTAWIFAERFVPLPVPVPVKIAVWQMAINPCAFRRFINYERDLPANVSLCGSFFAHEISGGPTAAAASATVFV